jgi:hypothetical protein
MIRQEMPMLNTLPILFMALLQVSRLSAFPILATKRTFRIGWIKKTPLPIDLPFVVASIGLMDRMPL